MTPPADHLILFDGSCNICNAAAEFIVRRDKQAVFRFVSIQSELGRKIYRASGLDPDDAQTWLLLTRGRALTRSEAALEIAAQLGGLWPLLGLLRIVPRSLRNGLYSMIAERRYCWFGRRDSCSIPSDEVRKRWFQEAPKELGAGSGESTKTPKDGSGVP